MIPRTDWTLSGLAVELDIDRRSLAKRLAGLTPISTATHGKKTERHYKLADVLEHLAGGDGDLDLNHERAVLTRLQQEKLQIELSELRAELVRAPILELHWQAAVSAMRARLLALPARCAPMLAPADQLLTVQELLRVEVYQALTEISGDAFPAEIRARLELAQSESAK